MSRKPVWPTMLRMDSMETCSQPLISVIIPVYNSQDTLRKAADSVLEQTYRNTELILVDDGSTDESPAIIDAYASAHPDRVRVIHKENGGLMRAWRDGLSLCTGQVLCFVDSDDWIDPEMIANMAAHLEKNSDGSYAPGQIVCCGYLIEYPDHAPKIERHGLPEGVYEGNRLDHELKKEILGHEKRRIIHSRCMKLISLELFTDNLRFLNPDIRQGEDANIIIPALLDARRVVVMNTPFYHYTYAESSMCHQYDSNYYMDCKRLREQFFLIRKEKPILPEIMIKREFLFMFLQMIKREIRRKDPPHPLKKAIRDIRDLCVTENSRELLKSYPEKLNDASYRLVAMVCNKPSLMRILIARFVFFLYDCKQGFR